MKPSKKKAKSGREPEIAAGWHGVPAVPLAERLSSLDAFRGFVIVTMVFVNNLGEGVPNWMRHMNDLYGPIVDGYTFVDLVFPGFLFMVGFSIPLSFFSKMSQGSNFPKLFWRVVARAAPLVLMGLIMVNPHPDPKFTGMSKPLWGALTYLSLILLFIARPKTISALGNRILTGLKIAPGILLVYLVFIYRTTGANGQTTWLQPHYWGILGEIGWAYLGAGSIYLLFRGSPTALMGILGLLTALDIGCRHELLGWLSSWNVFRDIFGTHSAIITAGMMLGNLFVGKGKVSNRQRGLFIAVFGAGLYLAGTWLRPLYGINKNGATVSWGLVSSGICCGVYLFFYWIMEIMKSRQWAEKSLVPVGQNALLAYLFGDAVFDFFKVIFRHDMPYAGPYLNAVVQVLVVCAFAWTCTKNKIFMRL